MDSPVVNNQRKKQLAAEMTSWIAISSLAVFAIGIGLECDRFMVQPSPKTLDKSPPLREYIPSVVFDTVCMSVTIVWMSILLGLHCWKQFDEQLAAAQDHPKPHIGSYLIYGLFLFVLGGTFRVIFQLMLFFKSDTQGIGRAYLITSILYINVQALFIHCNRKEILFKHHLPNGIVLFHTVVTNATLYVRVFVESKEDNREPSLCNCSNHEDRIRAYTLTTAESYPLTTAESIQNYEKLYKGASVFLSPFILEFALTAIAMLAELWSVSAHQGTKKEDATTTYGTMKLESKQHNLSQLTTTEKIKKAAGAVVLGLTVFVSYIFLIILLCYFKEQSNPNKLFQTYKSSSCMIMLVLCLIGLVVLQHCQKRQLKGAKLDEILIFISVVGPISIAVLHFIASVRELKHNESDTTVTYLYLFESVVSIFQSILQSILITKALHREPRALTGWVNIFNPCNLAILLAAFNLGHWLLATISLEMVGDHDHFLYTSYMVKEASKIDHDCFGATNWMVIKLFLYPLIVFYHIHSFFTFFRIFDIHSHIKVKP
jgi:hypothetical protein